MIDRVSSLIAALRRLAGHEHLLRQIESRGEGVHLNSTVEVRSPDRLVLGSDVVVDGGVLLHCGGMDWCPDRGGITIGSGSFIGSNAVLYGAGGIEIGEAVAIGAGAIITSQQQTFDKSDVNFLDQPMTFARIIIERDVMIAVNAVVLPGVRLGEGCIVGAGAVVTRDVPPRVVVTGVPARIVRER
jgi:acetyltransferase-like isoleucine patch superfamily enzyme